MPLVGHLHQPIQYPELHFQLDTVHEGLVGGLYVVEVRVLQAQYGNIEKNDEDIDQEQVTAHLGHSIAVQAVPGVEKGKTRLDVEGGDNEFLQEKHGDLDFLVGNIRLDPRIALGAVGPVHEDYDGDMKYEDVGDNHGQDDAEPGVIPEYEMQSRVEHEGLSRDHGHPSDGDEGDVQAIVLGPDDVFEKKADRVWYDAVGGGEKTPEVQAFEAPKGGEDDDVELESVVERQRYECDYGAGLPAGICDAGAWVA